jgi:hypothetical protein
MFTLREWQDQVVERSLAWVLGGGAELASTPPAAARASR